MTRRAAMVSRLVGAVLVIFLVGVCAASAQTGPQPPQSSTAMYNGQGPGMAFIASGQSLMIDPTGGAWGGTYGPCRKITNSGPATRMVSYGSQQAWLSVRAPLANLGTGSSTPNMYTDGTASEVVCCRPMPVSMCVGAASGQTTKSLPYDSYGDSQSVSAPCTRSNGSQYTDIETYACGQTGSGAAADGSWSFLSSTASCTPNWQSVYQGCTASCGGGQYQYYNYDTNNCSGSNAYYSYAGSCNTQSCCTPNWTCGACNGGGIKSCSDGCGNAQNQACTYMLIGGADCSPLSSGQCGGDIYTCGGPPLPNPPCPSTWSFWGTYSNCSPFGTPNPDGYMHWRCYGYQ